MKHKLFCIKLMWWTSFKDWLRLIDRDRKDLTDEQAREMFFDFLGTTWVWHYDN